MTMPSPSSWPLDSREHLDDALRQQGVMPEEIEDLAPIAQRLAEWPQRRITPSDTQRLLAALAPTLPRHSAVRQAVRAHYSQQRGSLAWLLDIARVQIGILRPMFWLASVVVALLGIALELAPWESDSALSLRALGPLLAYLSISTAFRSVGLRTVECEIACPATPLQLMLARVVVVLGYDVALGTGLSVAGWLRTGDGGIGLLKVTLHWLMPLLLVAGLALVLSLRLPATLAAGLAYACWLSALAVYYALYPALMQSKPVTPPAVPIWAELALGLAGLALLAAGTLRFPANVSRLLPTV